MWVAEGMESGSQAPQFTALREFPATGQEGGSEWGPSAVRGCS